MAYSYVPSAKALAFQRDLAAAVEARLADPAFGISGETVVKSFSAVTDLEGAPLISVKASGGNVDALLRIEQVGTIAKDILGLPQTVFTPHICKLILDSDLSLALDNYTKLLTAVGGECMIHGIKLEVYAAAAATEANLSSGNLKTVFDSVQYPLMSTL
jgi:hypothetical protein